MRGSKAARLASRELFVRLRARGNDEEGAAAAPSDAASGPPSSAEPEAWVAEVPKLPVLRPPPADLMPTPSELEPDVAEPDEPAEAPPKLWRSVFGGKRHSSAAPSGQRLAMRNAGAGEGGAARGSVRPGARGGDEAGDEGSGRAPGRRKGGGKKARRAGRIPWMSVRSLVKGGASEPPPEAPPVDPNARNAPTLPPTRPRREAPALPPPVRPRAEAPEPAPDSSRRAPTVPPMRARAETPNPMRDPSRSAPTLPPMRASALPPDPSRSAPTLPPMRASVLPPDPSRKAPTIPPTRASVLPPDPSRKAPTIPPMRASVLPPDPSRKVPTIPPMRVSVLPPDPSRKAPTIPPMRASVLPPDPSRNAPTVPRMRASIVPEPPDPSRNAPTVPRLRASVAPEPPDPSRNAPTVPRLRASVMPEPPDPSRNAPTVPRMRASSEGSERPPDPSRYAPTMPRMRAATPAKGTSSAPLGGAGSSTASTIPPARASSASDARAASRAQGSTEAPTQSRLNALAAGRLRLRFRAPGGKATRAAARAAREAREASGGASARGEVVGGELVDGAAGEAVAAEREDEAAVEAAAFVAGSPEATQFARGVLTVCCLAVFAASLSITALYVAFDDIGRTFTDSSVADLSWVLNANTIVFSALIVPAGRVADRLGHKRSFLLGLATFSAASALCGVAPSVALLVAARGLQASGAALLMPSSLALVLRANPPGRRASALGIWSAVSALAAAFGPALGSLLVHQFGWRSVFLANVPIGLLAYVRGRRTLAESPRDADSPLPDPFGAALLVVALSAFALGAVKGAEWGWGGSRITGALLVGAAASAAFVVRSRRVRTPVLDLALFADRTCSVANFATFAFTAGFTAAFFGNVLFLTKVWGYPLRQAGLAVTPGPLSVVPMAVVAGRLADKHGYRPVLVAGGLVAAAGGAWLSHVTAQAPDFLTLWLPGMVLTGAGVGLVLPAVGGASTATLPARSFAVGGAVNQAVRQFGAVLGVALVVALLSAAGVGGERDALGKAYAAFGALGFVASLCGLGLGAARSVRRPPMGESIPAPAPASEPAPELEPEPASMPAPDSGARTTLVTGVEPDSAPDSGARTTLVTGLEPAPAPGSRFAAAAPVSSRAPESRPAPALAPVSSRGPESKRAPESKPASIPAPVSSRGPESKRAPASIPAPVSSRGPESKPAPASEPEGAAT